MTNFPLSITSTSLAAATIFVGESDKVIQSFVASHPNEDLIKFIAPIVAGLLGKLIDILAKRKQKKKEVENE